MAVATPTFEVTKVLIKTAVILSTTLLTVATVYHVHSIWKQKKKNPQQSYKAAYVSLLLIAFAYESFIVIMVQMFAPTEQFCMVKKVLAIPPSLIFKMILYLICAHRLHQVFGEKRYSAKSLKIWSAIVIIWSVLNIVLFEIFAENIHISKHNYCHMNDDTYVSLTSMALLDIAAAVVYSYLFIRPLLVMRKEAQITQMDQRMVNAAKKQVVLALCIVFSLFLAMLGIMLFKMDELWVAIGGTISALSVILMFKWNDVIVFKLCFCCFKELYVVGDDKSHSPALPSVNEATVDAVIVTAVVKTKAKELN